MAAWDKIGCGQCPPVVEKNENLSLQGGLILLHWRLSVILKQVAIPEDVGASGRTTCRASYRFLQQAFRYAGYPLHIGGVLFLASRHLSNSDEHALWTALLTVGSLPLLVLAEYAIMFNRAWRCRAKEIAVVLLHTFVSTEVVNLAVRPFLAFCFFTLGKSLAQSLGTDSLWDALNFDQLPFAAQCGLALLVMELGWYWGHRLTHEFPALWPMHALHHSAERLTFFEAGRNHPFDTVKTLLVTTPVAFLGAPEAVFFINYLLIAIHNMWAHANADITLGYFRYVLNSPELHRHHHSQNIDESNKNFGSVLSVFDHISWDRIPVFGNFLKFKGPTYYFDPNPEKQHVLGLKGETLTDFRLGVLRNYGSQLAYPLRLWRAMIKQN